eukprot:TRINITY_DN1406_c0_g1_i1.p1 TRINITY_DN1406_c0_g1~~TRINITY_DN1406_c0_g1_i1.p1  ORF type:complete len:1886 (-),score=296.76 TRINITY_DN1406_c0_g1_i1:52-5709(-)
MWIERKTFATVESLAKWTVLESNDFFVMEWQQDVPRTPTTPTDSPGFRHIILTKPYRIILCIDTFPNVYPRETPEPGTDPADAKVPLMILAIADDEQVIREHWSYLTRNILPQATQFDKTTEQMDLSNFITKKIAAMATEEDLAQMGKNTRRSTANTPKYQSGEFLTKSSSGTNSPSSPLALSSTEPVKSKYADLKHLIRSHAGDWETEKRVVLVDYECTFLVEIKRPGCMWITPNGVYFLDHEARTHVLLRMHEIVYITMKSITNSTIPDAIELGAAKSKTPYLFTDFKITSSLGVELVQRVIESLWNASLYRIHSLSVSTLLEKEGIFDDEEESEESSEEDSDSEDDFYDDEPQRRTERTSVTKTPVNEVFVLEGLGGEIERQIAEAKPSSASSASLSTNASRLKNSDDGENSGNSVPKSPDTTERRLADSGLRASRRDSIIVTSGGTEDELPEIFTVPKRRGRTSTRTSSRPVPIQSEGDESPRTFTAASNTACNLSYFAATEINRKSKSGRPAEAASLLDLPFPLSVDALLTMEKRDVFHRLFRLPLDEVIEDVLWGTITQGAITKTGHIFITTNYLCFHSVPKPLFGGKAVAGPLNITSTPSSSSSASAPPSNAPSGSSSPNASLSNRPDPKKPADYTAIIALDELVVESLKIGNKAQEFALLREECNAEDVALKARAAKVTSPDVAARFKSVLGNKQSNLYRSLTSIPHIEELRDGRISPMRMASSDKLKDENLKLIQAAAAAVEQSRTLSAENAKEIKEGASLERRESLGDTSTPLPGLTVREQLANSSPASIGQAVSTPATPLMMMYSSAHLPLSTHTERRASISVVPDVATDGQDGQKPKSAERNVRKMLERMVSETSISDKIPSSPLSNSGSEVSDSVSSTVVAEVVSEQEVVQEAASNPEDDQKGLRERLEAAERLIEELKKQLAAKDQEIQNLNKERDAMKFRMASLEGPSIGTKVAIPNGLKSPQQLRRGSLPEREEDIAAERKKFESRPPSALSSRQGSKENVKEGVPIVQQTPATPIVTSPGALLTAPIAAVSSSDTLPTKEPAKTAATDQSKVEPALDEFGVLVDDKSECLVFLLQNTKKWLISVEASNFTTKTKDLGALLSLVQKQSEACHARVKAREQKESKSTEIIPVSTEYPGIPSELYTPPNFSSGYLEKQHYRGVIWERYFAVHGRDKSMMRNHFDMTTLAFSYDVPDNMRGELWQIFSGASFYIHRAHNEYANILKNYEGLENEFSEAIGQDLTRSFPTHPHFQSEQGMKRLKNVLTAYSWRNPQVGYTQGMNIIAALLLTFMSEEQVFWVMCYICEVLYPEYYNNGFLGLVIDQRVFVELAEEKLPDVCAVFGKRGIPLALIVAPWFMTIYVSQLTLEASLHVMSNVLFGGPDSPLIFKVGLAVLRLKKQELAERDDINPVDVCHDIPLDELCKAVEEYREVTPERVRELRKKYRYQVIVEMLGQSGLSTSAVEYNPPEPVIYTKDSGMTPTGSYVDANSQAGSPAATPTFSSLKDESSNLRKVRMVGHTTMPVLITEKEKRQLEKERKEREQADREQEQKRHAERRREREERERKERAYDSDFSHSDLDTPPVIGSPSPGPGPTPAVSPVDVTPFFPLQHPQPQSLSSLIIANNSNTASNHSSNSDNKSNETSPRSRASSSDSFAPFDYKGSDSGVVPTRQSLDRPHMESSFGSFRTSSPRPKSTTTLLPGGAPSRSASPLPPSSAAISPSGTMTQALPIQKPGRRTRRPNEGNRLRRDREGNHVDLTNLRPRTMQHDRSRPPKSPRSRPRHRRYISGVITDPSLLSSPSSPSGGGVDADEDFDSDTSAGAAAPARKPPLTPEKSWGGGARQQDLTQKGGSGALGILDVIYGLFSEPSKP